MPRVSGRSDSAEKYLMVCGFPSSRIWKSSLVRLGINAPCLSFIIGKRAGGWFILVLCLAGTLARAQDQQEQQQSVPDAPSPTRPPQQFPTTSPPTNTQPRPSKEPPKSDSPPRSDEPVPSSDQPAPVSEEPAPTPPPMPP